MLEVTCSKCGSKRLLQSLEDLVYAKFCDKCGQSSTCLSVTQILAYLEHRPVNVTPKNTEGLREEKKSLEDHNQQLQITIAEKTASLHELEAKTGDLKKHEERITRNVLDQETKLKSVENDIKSSADRIRELHQEQQLLETQDQQLKSAVREKTTYLEELEAKIKNLNTREKEVNQRILLQEEKLKSTENNIEQYNNRIRDLKNATITLESQKQKLEVEISSFTDQNRQLDKLLQDKRTQLSELETKSKSPREADQIEPTPDGRGDLEQTPDAARREAHSLEWLGIVAKHREQYDKSEQYYREALKIRQELGDEEDEAFTLSLLLDLAKERKEYAIAQEYGMRAMEIHTRLGDKQGEKKIAEALRAISNIEHPTD